MLRLKVRNLLKLNGLTITKSRVKVLQFFLRINKPLSLKTIRLSFKDLDRVTLFRILSVFEKNKIIHAINLENGRKLYALCNYECDNSSNHVHNHIHFHCQRCHEVSCLAIEKFPKLSLSDYIFKEININVSGLCLNCN